MNVRIVTEVAESLSKLLTSTGIHKGRKKQTSAWVLVNMTDSDNQEQIFSNVV